MIQMPNRLAQLSHEGCWDSCCLTRTRGTPACTRQRSCGSQSGIASSEPPAPPRFARHALSAALKGASPDAHAASRSSAVLPLPPSFLRTLWLGFRGDAALCAAAESDLLQNDMVLHLSRHLQSIRSQLDITVGCAAGK